MNTTTRIQHKGQVTIPTRVREQAGLSKGDLVEFSFQRGKIVITPKLVVDRSKFPNAGSEYTPEQRRVIDRRLALADADIKAGRVSKAFSNAGDLIADLQKAVKKNRKAASKRAAK
ncbi:MAG: AbrB/MazE/SpoVT family DNA-binding domain-containing protein [Bryobacteraceae bacterium]|nr:AbrB/MazE/SpoVT family DNA-binding domain-containing protein [Bryobacteraceae bacterium]